MDSTFVLAAARQEELKQAAERSARVRRLAAARKWQRRAQSASRRARLAAAAVR